MNECYSLISAVQRGDLEAVRVLISLYGLSYSPHWSEGYWLLFQAVKHRQSDVAKLLLECGSKVSSPTPPNTVLHHAVLNVDIEVVKMILDKGADIDTKDEEGKTPIFVAIFHMKIEATELLLKEGARVDIIDRNGFCPFHVAVTKKCYEIVERLLTYGAPVNCPSASRWSKGYAPLHFAVEQGSMDLIRLLLENGANLHARDEQGFTPLHIAAKEGRDEAVELLLSRGADIDNASTKSKLTPLHLATEKDHKEVVRLLLQHGAEVDIQNKDGKAVLQLAVEKGYVTIVEDVLKYRPDIYSKSTRRSLAIAVTGYTEGCKRIVDALLDYGLTIDLSNANNFQLIHAAAKNGHLKMIEELLQYVADINQVHRTSSGFTLLHSVVEKNQEEVASLLLKHRADVNSRDKMGRYPIFYAISNANFKMFKLLLDNGANIKDTPELLNIAVEKESLEMVRILVEHLDVNASDEYGRAALHFTVLSGDEGALTSLISQEDVVKSISNIDVKVEIAELLLNKGSKVNAQTKKGLTALHGASRKGYAKLVRVLLERKASVSQVEEHNRTPLHFSAHGGNAEITTMLLDKGADVNARKHDRNTALHLAAMRSHIEVLRVLLKRGAEVDSKNLSGIIPLHISATRGDAEIVRTLLKFDANINSRNPLGETALHNAAEKERIEVVQTLLEHGFDVNASNGNTNIPPIIDVNSRDKHGRTALYVAAGKGCSEVVRILLEYGSDVNIRCRNNYTPLNRAVSPTYNDGHFRALNRHFVKMKAANLYVSERDFQCEANRITSFHAECAKEISSMKNEKIHNSRISFYDILTKCSNSIAICMGNENIVQALKSYDYEMKFPIYARMIDCNFKRNIERKALLEHGNAIFHSLCSSFTELPYDCIENIFSFLSNEDLRILIIPNFEYLNHTFF